jgi:dTDP-4-dehydrorhamnose 3,5-epimerase
VPPGYAHGFLTLSDTAQVIYKTTDYYAPEDEHAILYADDRLKITWPDTGVNIALSEKDRAAKLMSEAALPA